MIGSAIWGGPRPGVFAVGAAALTAGVAAVPAGAAAASATAVTGTTAPGAPGAPSYFDVARKDCVGTAANRGSRVWYTVADGVLRTSTSRRSITPTSAHCNTS